VPAGVRRVGWHATDTVVPVHCGVCSCVPVNVCLICTEYEAERKRESGEDVREEDKEKPDFGLSGALAKDVVTGNVYNGVVLKWTEPLDASPASKGWRVYVFKGDDLVETLHLHRQSAFLFGREARVADHVLGEYSYINISWIVLLLCVILSGCYCNCFTCGCIYQHIHLAPTSTR
jgi:hypothetical protein